ncbi:hypothetical protein DV736_g3363, partial [Chaetothyriales sp. CBS 134916]
MAERSKTPDEPNAAPEAKATAKATPKQSLIVRAKHWGEYLLNLLLESSLPPTLLATLIFAQHARPFQFVPMLFPPLLLFSTYLNLNGYKIDSAGTTAALSGSYLVLAGRRKQGIWSRFGTRGVIRGATMGLALANVIGGGLAYTFGRRAKEEEEREHV